MMPYMVRADVVANEVHLRTTRSWSGLQATSYSLGDSSRWPEFLTAYVELYWPDVGYKIQRVEGGVRWALADAKKREYVVDFSGLSAELEPMLVGAWVEFP